MKTADLKQSNDEYWLDEGIDLYGRKIMLDDDVTHLTMGKIYRAVDKMDSMNCNPIEIHISTFGGSTYDSLSLYNRLRRCRSQIVTVGTGKVMSAGTWLILAGDQRWADKDTTFMWHAINTSNPSDMRMFESVTDVAEIKRLWGRLLDIYADRTVKTKAWWNRWLQYEDRYGDAERAQELGFIDKII